jgi:thymidylate kinase
VGKTTLCGGLADYLHARGRVVHLLASPGRKPRTLGRLVWRLHHSPAEFDVATVHPVSLQLLHVAARIDALEGVIRPALRAGEDVVLDRFWWSTLAYGTRAGISPSSLNRMIAMEYEHWEGIAPTKIFLIYRERPFRSEVPQEEFESLNDLYMALANETPNVTVFENSGTIESALHRITGAVVDDAASGDWSPETQLSE